MIRLLLVILLQLLGFNDNNQRPVNSLHKQPDRMVINLEFKMLMLLGIGMALFFILIFMFSPGTESGLWYNNPHY